MPRPSFRSTILALVACAGLAAWPGAGWSQAPTAPSPPSATPAPGAATPSAPRRPATSTLNWSQMDDRQRRAVQRGMAAPGAAPLSAEEAQRRWDGMSRSDRHRTLESARAARQQPRQDQQQRSAQPRPAQPRPAQPPAQPPAPAPAAPTPPAR